MSNNENRGGQFLVGMVILFIILAALREAQGLAVILILAGLAYLASRFSANNGQESWGRWLSQLSDTFSSTNGEDYADEPEPARQAAAEPVYKHALEAVRRAGLNPDDVQVLVVDIGTMAFKGDQDPVVYRTWEIPDDVDYIQPFVQLRLPTRATGRIRFEVIDNEGETMFVHEDMHQLVRGRNLVTPAARLPVHDAQAMDGQWTLKVSADGVTIAEHRFTWEEATSTTIRRHISEDGEISNEMRAALAENRLGKMSLEELLSFQEDDEPQQQQRRK
jgi:hypothetical protein